jgi:hypothetical protein
MKPLIEINRTGIHFPRWPRFDSWLTRRQYWLALAMGLLSVAAWLWVAKYSRTETGGHWFDGWMNITHTKTHDKLIIIKPAAWTNIVIRSNTWN